MAMAPQQGGVGGRPQENAKPHTLFLGRALILQLFSQGSLRFPAGSLAPTVHTAIFNLVSWHSVHITIVVVITLNVFETRRHLQNISINIGARDTLVMWLHCTWSGNRTKSTDKCREMSFSSLHLSNAATNPRQTPRFH